MGNCGVGLAPCKPDVHEIAAWDLVNVEAIPIEVLGKGVTWDWETFPEYIGCCGKAWERNQYRFHGCVDPISPFCDG